MIKQKQVKFLRIALSVLTLLFIYLRTYQIMTFLGSSDLDLVSSAYILLVIFYYLIILLEILGHELGHCLIGLFVGFKLNFLKVSSIYFFAGRNGYFFERRKGTGRGGLTYFHPVNRKHLKIKYSLMILAGPITNFAMAIFVLAFILLYHPDFTGNPLLFLVYNLTTNLWVFMNIITGLSNLIPYQSEGLFTSDGEKLFTFLRNGERADELRIALEYDLFNGYPLRPREWEGKGIDFTNTSIFLQDYVFAYQKDMHNIDEMKKCIKNISEAYPKQKKLQKYDSALEITIFLAKFTEETGKARAWLEEARKYKTIENDFSWFLAEAYVSFSEEDYASALDCASKGLNSIQRFRLTGIIIMYEEWFQSLIQNSTTKLIQHSQT